MLKVYHIDSYLSIIYFIYKYIDKKIYRYIDKKEKERLKALKDGKSVKSNENENMEEKPEETVNEPETEVNQQENQEQPAQEENNIHNNQD